MKDQMPFDKDVMNAECSSSDGVSRRVGPVGRALRIAAGVLLLVSLAGFYVEVPVALALRSAAATVGIFLVYALIHRLIAAMPAVARRRWLTSILSLVPLILVYVFGMVGGPIFGAGEGQLAALTFLGISLVLAGLRGDRGCEVMAMPNLLFGRDADIQCLVFTPLDRIEKRLADRRS